MLGRKLGMGAAGWLAAWLAAPSTGLATDLDTVTVDTLSDDSPGSGDCTTAAGDCSLRQAIAVTNDGDAGTGGNPTLIDQILFAAGLSGTLTLGGTELPTIEEDVIINGPGAKLLTVSGGNSSRIFHIDLNNIAGLEDHRVGIYDLTLADGTASGTGLAANGGAIFNHNADTLKLDHVVVRDSEAEDLGGGIYLGPAVDDPQIYFSTISGNTALTGGGIYAGGNFDALHDSTVSGNTALADYGGGLYVYCASGAVMSSTIAGNYAAVADAGIATGFYCQLAVSNTIVADNLTGTGADDVGGYFWLATSNVEAPTYADLYFDPARPSQVGIDPQLGPLQDNGGPTPTQRPATTSPVVDRGLPPEIEDQRGISRPVDFAGIPNVGGPFPYAGGDIGSVELTIAEGPAPPAASPQLSDPKQLTPRKKCKKRHKRLAGSAKKKCKRHKRKRRI
jgi:hypothetical protein